MSESVFTSKSLQGTLAGFLACIIWSSAILVMHRIAEAFGALPAMAYELLIAGFFLLAISYYRGDLYRVRLHSLYSQLICGIMWLMNVAFFWLAVGLVNNSAELLVTGLLNYLWPALTLLLTIVILKKKAVWKWLVPGLALSCSGIALGKIATTSSFQISQIWVSLNLPAYISAVLAALTWGLYSNFSRKLSNPAGASPVALYMLIGGAILSLLFYVIEPGPLAAGASNANKGLIMGVHFNDWLLLIGWSLASSLAYLGWDTGMRKGNIVAISTASMLIPLFSTIITATLSGYGLSFEILMAAIFVIAGSAICRKGVL